MRFYAGAHAYRVPSESRGDPEPMSDAGELQDHRRKRPRE